VLGENRPRSQNAATEVNWRATLGRSKFCIEEQGFVRAGCCAALGLYQTLEDAEVVNQSNRKRCWSTALQKLLLQSFTPEA